MRYYDTLTEQEKLEFSVIKKGIIEGVFSRIKPLGFKMDEIRGEGWYHVSFPSNDTIDIELKLLLRNVVVLEIGKNNCFNREGRFEFDIANPKIEDKIVRAILKEYIKTCAEVAVNILPSKDKVNICKDLINKKSKFRLGDELGMALRMKKNATR